MIMRKNQEKSAKRFIWKKGPVARTIWYSYLVVLLLPLLLTMIITTVAVLRLQADNAQRVTATSTELSRLLSAYMEEIQTGNSRILLSDETKQLSIVNRGAFTPRDIQNLAKLQKQLPKDTVASEYINSIYVCFLRSGATLTSGSAYFDDDITFMLRDRLGMSLSLWKQILDDPSVERATLVTGDLDQKGHILISARLSTTGKHSDVVVISEFKNEKAAKLLNEFSENGELVHTLIGEDGASFSVSPVTDTASWEELLLPVGPDAANIRISLSTRTPKNRFLRKTMPLFLGLSACALIFAVIGWFLIHYYTRRQYSPIERLNASLLASLDRNGPESDRGKDQNEYDQMSAAVTALLQTTASSREENELLRENIRKNLLQGILFGNIRKEEIILRHAENNGIRFIGHRFLVVLYAIEDLQRQEQSDMLLQDEEALYRLDELVRAAIRKLVDNGSARYTVEVEEKVACVISLPDSLSPEQIWTDVLANIQQVREFFRASFGVILTAAVSALHSGVVSITTCFRECREAADYMELIGTNIPVCRYDQIPTIADDTLSFPELLEKEKKLCRNLSTGDYLSAETAWQDVVDALSLRKCSLPEARARLLGVVSLMASSFGDLPPEMEDRVRLAFDANLLQLLPGLDSMLEQVQTVLASLAAYASEEKQPAENSKELQFIAYVNDHLTDPNLSISVIADHFDMSTSYFSKRFKKAAGENLLDYIHRERLALAKQIMAEHPEATLKEICDQVGYASPLTLNRAFRKYEGITPSDYRMQM